MNAAQYQSHTTQAEVSSPPPELTVEQHDTLDAYSPIIDFDNAPGSPNPLSDSKIAVQSITNFEWDLDQLRLHGESSSDKDSTVYDSESESGDTSSDVDEDEFKWSVLDELTANGLSLEDKLREQYERSLAELGASISIRPYKKFCC